MAKRIFAKIKRYANNIRKNSVFKLENIIRMVSFSLILSWVLLAMLAIIPDMALSATEVIDEVIASVNGDIITRNELEQNTRIFKTFGMKKEIGSSRKLEKTVLHQMIDNYLLQQEAEKQNITVSSADIQKALQNLQENVSGGNLIQRVKKKGITLNSLKENIKREILKERIIKWKAKKWQREEIQIKDEQVQNFFSSLKWFVRGEEVGDGDINQFCSVYRRQLLEEEKVFIAQIIVDARKKAEQIVRKWQKGKDFSTLAAQYSLGPKAKDGGEVGWFSLAEIPNSLRTVISKLEEGEVTDPIKWGERSYRIFKVKRRKQLSYQRWKEKIKNYLFHKEVMKLLDKWLKTLRRESFIQIVDEDLKKGWKN